MTTTLDLDHKEMVAQLAKPGEDILTSLTPEKCHIWHMGGCVPEEAGELYSAIKKFLIYGKALDRENVVEELGDLEFYMRGLRDALGITREETLEHNLNKLLTGKNARYGKGEFSNEQAQNRADKQQESS